MEDLDRKKAEKKIKKLRSVIRRHRYLYHVKNEQEISPEALDSLKKKLSGLEKRFPDLVTADSPTQRVAGEPLEEFEKVVHPEPMLSINDAFGREDMEDWEERNGKLLEAGEKRRMEYFCEFKFDGLALELIYRRGSLETGTTRGDGRVGEGVTENAKSIESIPLKLRTRKGESPPEVVVRGEVLIRKEDFKRLNRKRDKEGKSGYANPRNLAAGSMRQLDPRVPAGRNLDFYAYGLVSDLGQKTHREEHEVLKRLGFKVSPRGEVCAGLESVLSFFREVKEERENLPYEIDGVVVTVNQKEILDKLGTVGKGPRGLVALKFPLKRSTTNIEEIKVQVGRTGILTPVAVLEPVEVGGVTITRATLHNQEEMERLGVKVGDTVVVGRAGDVIPEVMKVVSGLRSGEEEKFRMPEKCPVCGEKVEREDGGVLLKCPNPDCPAKERKALYHFVSKGAFDIEGLGPKRLDKLRDEGLVQSAPDLFELKEGDLMPLENFQEKASRNLVRAIQTSKDISLPRFLYSLGIPNVGRETALLLARHFGSLEALRRAGKPTLETVEGVGPKMAGSIRDWFREEGHQALIRGLKQAGVELRPFRPFSSEPVLENKTFVFTGALDSMNRREAKRKVRERRGKTSASLSGKTDFLVVGESPGGKLERAEEEGVECLSESEFLALIGEK